MTLPKSSSEILDIPSLTEKLLRGAVSNPGIDAYKPHASQEKFHCSIAKEKLYIGGNRSGKTTGAIAEDVMRACGRHPYRTDLPSPPVYGRIVAVDFEEGVKKMVIPELQKWTPLSMLRNGSWDDSYDKQSRTLTLVNGSFIELMSYEQEVEKFAGTSRHFVHFDEEPPEDIYDECMMRLVDTDGDYWIAMTPLIELSWVKDKLYDPWLRGDESVYVLEVDTEENPYIQIEVLNRLTRKMSDEQKDTRTKGTFITHTGLIYGEACKIVSYREGGNIVPDILGADFKAFTAGWSHFVCMDHGLHNPTVFLFCCFDSMGRIIVYDELYISGREKRLVKDNARRYNQRLEALGIYPIYCVGDPNIQNRNAVTGTSVQTEYAEHQVMIALGHNDVNAGITRTQNRFSEGYLYISERCVETLKELRNYRWDRYASSRLAARKNKKEVPLKKNDHCMDALRYGVMSRPAIDTIGETSVGNIINAPVAGPIEFDYELVFSNPENPGHKVYDEVLGTEW